jgi:isoquinoline 1-oxidoreductase beta subunit
LDFLEQGVQVAKAVSPAPVKLIWSRETDMQQDFYRPAVIGRFRGALDANGKPGVWTCSYTGSGLGGAARPIYPVPHQDIRGAEAPGHLRTGFWRGVEHTQHGFFMESFIDELAHAAGQDPFAYRQSLLADKPRHLAVLERAARMAGWGAPLPPGEGRGIAIVEGFGSITAQVAEVKVTPAGEVRVQRVFAAIDCGQVINPDTAETQIAGGIMFALSATLFGEITVRDGKVEQDNFPSYDVVRMANAPRVTVEFISSPALIGGVGEAGTPPVAPSVTNAIFAATGQRIRTLPLKNHSLAYQPAPASGSPSNG